MYQCLKEALWHSMLHFFGHLLFICCRMKSVICHNSAENNSSEHCKEHILVNDIALKSSVSWHDPWYTPPFDCGAWFCGHLVVPSCLYWLLPREHIRYLGHQRKHKVQDVAHFINTRPTISIVVLNLHVILEHFASDFQIMYYGHELKISVLGPLSMAEGYRATKQTYVNIRQTEVVPHPQPAETHETGTHLDPHLLITKWDCIVLEVSTRSTKPFLHIEMILRGSLQVVPMGDRD